MVEDAGAANVIDAGDDSSDSEIDPTKAYSFQFYTQKVSECWSQFKTHGVVHDKCVDMSDAKKYKLDAFLKSVGLLDVVSYATPFVMDVVLEFYVNLPRHFADPQSPQYGDVYVRSKKVRFTPSVINKFLNRADVEEESIVLDDVATISKLITRNKAHMWSATRKGTHQNCRSLYLTALFAALHKLYAANWIPTTNPTLVSLPQMKLLYRIGSGVPVDLGKIIFQEIGKVASQKKWDTFLLPYPSLIFGILKDEGVPILVAEPKVTTRAWTVSPNFSKPSHFQDLP